jgi:hypothetical protein
MYKLYTLQIVQCTNYTMYIFYIKGLDQPSEFKNPVFEMIEVTGARLKIQTLYSRWCWGQAHA